MKWIYKMKTNNLSGIILWLVLSGFVFGLTGCPGDFLRYGEVKDIEGYPNAFRISPVYSNEHIHGL